MTERLTDEQYEAIVDAHPGVRLRRIPSAAGELVIRAPTGIEESTFQSMYFGSSMHAGMAWRNLLSMLIVHPAPAQFKVVLEQWTGLVMNPRVIRELKLIRGEVDEEEGK
jgi:hypothetical protein